jgi:hypothetical protein
MTAHLAILLLASLTLPRGGYAAHLASHELGPHVRAEQLAERIVSAAELYDVPVPLYTALLLAESNLDPDAVSRTGAAGIPQLQPPRRGSSAGRWWRDWRADCTRAPDACEQASLWHGARALRHALNGCRGDRACAVARYRGVKHGRVREMDRAVVADGQRIAWRLRWMSARRVVIARVP